jgi:hypothetical protein
VWDQHLVREVEWLSQNRARAVAPAKSILMTMSALSLTRDGQGTSTENLRPTFSVEYSNKNGRKVEIQTRHSIIMGLEEY